MSAEETISLLSSCNIYIPDQNAFSSDILSHVFPFLPPKDLLNASLVCKQWNHASLHDSLWYERFEREVEMNKYFEKNFIKESIWEYIPNGQRNIPLQDAEDTRARMRALELQVERSEYGSQRNCYGFYKKCFIEYRKRITPGRKIRNIQHKQHKYEGLIFSLAICPTTGFFFSIFIASMILKLVVPEFESSLWWFAVFAWMFLGTCAGFSYLNTCHGFSFISALLGYKDVNKNLKTSTERSIVMSFYVLSSWISVLPIMFKLALRLSVSWYIIFAPMMGCVCVLMLLMISATYYHLRDLQQVLRFCGPIGAAGLICIIQIALFATKFDEKETNFMHWGIVLIPAYFVQIPWVVSSLCGGCVCGPCLIYWGAGNISTRRKLALISAYFLLIISIWCLLAFEILLTIEIEPGFCLIPLLPIPILISFVISIVHLGIFKATEQ